MSGILIDSNLRSSGTISEANFSFSQDIQGNYLVLFHFIQDGIIPAVYSGCNNLSVTNVTTATTILVSFSDLVSDDPADVCQWFEDNLMAASAFPASTITCTTSDVGETYDLDFGIETFSFNLSLLSSTMSKILGSEDLSGTSFSVSGYHLDCRPALLAFNIDEASDRISFTSSSYANLIISTKDEHIKGHYIQIQDAVNQLRLKVYRINVPNIVCPISINYIIFLQKLLNGILIS